VFFCVGIIYFVIAFFWFEFSYMMPIFRGLVAHGRWRRARL